MQLEPIKPTLKPPGTERLKLKCYTLHLTFAFKFNLRRYIMAMLDSFLDDNMLIIVCEWAGGRALHSSTVRLNVSALCGIGVAFMGCLGGVQGVLGGIRGCLGCILSKNGSG